MKLSTCWVLIMVGCGAAAAQADIDVDLPVLAGGIQMTDYATCQQALKRCQVNRDAVEANITCTQQLYATNDTCRQTQAIEAQTGVLPEVANIHRQGAVTWFYVNHLADGIDSYYLLDSTGHLMGLATSQNKLIAESPRYQKMMQPYPDGALQSIVTTPRAKTPVIRQQSDGSLQFVFSQYLKKQDCVACQVVGQAELVYYFDEQGRYRGVQWA